MRSGPSDSLWRSWRSVAMWGCAAALLIASGAARAGNILRASSAATAPGSAAAIAAAQAAQAAAAAGQDAQNSLQQALGAFRQWQAAQEVARAAGQGAASNVPNGLVPGGLEIAPGTPPSGAILETPVTKGGRTEVTIDQTQQRAILTWDTFNVGSQTDVLFDQHLGGANAPSWVVLNRVLDPNGNPTQILGSISAAGQVYIINANGVIFGAHSQVNVGSLLVSGLNLLPPAGTGLQTYFESATTPLYQLAFGAAAGQGGAVTIDPGASIAAADGGRVVLLGGQVQNGGSIVAPNGEVFLAAGSTVQLVAPTSTSGPLVGLSPPITGNSYPTIGTISADGVVTNSGLISAPLGSIVMVAQQTNQNGLLNATTGAQASGYIYLGLAGGVTTFGGTSVTQILPDAGGQPVIGTTWSQQSQVVVHGDQIVLLDGASIYAPSGNVQLQAVMTTDPTGSGVDDSRIYVGSGARIDVSGLLDVQVPMAQNSIEATLGLNELANNPLLRNNPAFHGQTVWFDGRFGVNEQVADLSGYYNLIQRDVTQLMTNGGSVTLNANTIITRQGSVINLSGGSLAYQGGYVKSSDFIDPNGNVVPIEDAVPGVAYVGISNEFTVNHSRWGVLDTYSSPFALVTPQYEPGYVQGGNAGSLTVGTNAPVWFGLGFTESGGYVTPPVNPSATGAYRIFDGQITATTVVGPNQTQPNTGSSALTQVWQEQPTGATLTINNAGNVTVVPNYSPLLSAGFGPDSKVDPSLQYQIELPGNWFNGGSAAHPAPGVFSSATISCGLDPDGSSQTDTAGTTNRAYGGYLTIGQGVTVDMGDQGARAPGLAAFAFSGTSAQIDGTILAPGGNVSLSALQLASAQTLQNGGETAVANENAVVVSSTGVIDVAGRLTNYFQDGYQGPLQALNGGNVSITASKVALEPGSLVDVSGGAEVNTKGKEAQAGNGGSISINVSKWYDPDPNQYLNQVTSGYVEPPFQGSLLLGGELDGYAVGKGGSLAVITGYHVVIGNSLPGNDTGPSYRLFTPGFFTQGGFSSYTIVGEQGITVSENVVVSPSTETLVFSTSAASLPTGTRLDGVLPLCGSAQCLGQATPNPMSITLSTLPYTSAVSPAVVLEAGAKIDLSSYPGSAVNLSSQDVEIDGTIDAPGGAIDLFAQNANHGTLTLNPGAALTASGYQNQTYIGNDQVVRSVGAGGTVSLSSDDSIDIEPGASINVSGVKGFADLPSGVGGPGAATYVPVAVDGNAGSVSITAATGLVAGNLSLAPGGPSGLGGSLAIYRNTSGGAVADPLIVAPTATEAKASGLGASDLVVGADVITSSAADNLTLQTVAPNTQTVGTNHDAILFLGDVSLQARNSITLVAPVLGTYVETGQSPAATSVALTSSYVDLQGGVSSTKNLTSLVGSENLNSTLTVNADVIDVARTLFLGCLEAGCASGGFGTANLGTKGFATSFGMLETTDIRLSDRDAAGNASSEPGLISSGGIVFTSAQVYVTSRQEGTDPLERPAGDPGFQVSSQEQIAIVGTSNASPPPVPQSFGERLTLEAPTIDQGGVLRAPQGQLFLVGEGTNGSVTLEPGSVTSAALGGVTVAFGPVATGGVFAGYESAGESPTKSVNLSAPHVSVKKGAVIDVSGGGDLEGYIWTAGIGGTQDVLSSLNGFAVVPSIGSGPVPIAPVSSLSDPRLSVGDTVYLQGVPGLPNGTYTLLPAHYALLPGGFLVVPMAGSYASPIPTTYNSDGSVVASGYETRSGTPGYELFVVMSQQVFGEYSEFTSYSFNQFATNLAAQAGAVVRTPNDAGTVVLNAGQSLSLLGTGRLQGGSDGLLGNLDISATDIAVVGAGVVAPTGYVTVEVQSLEDFGAGSVLIGGTRTQSATNTLLTVNSDNVLVNTGRDAWTAPEILLAATNSVTVADGAVLRAKTTSGNVSLDTSPILYQPQSAPAGQNDFAFLRLSAGPSIPVSPESAIAADSSTMGSLFLGTGSRGAILSASGSMALQGTYGLSISPSSTLASPQLDLASTIVNLGNVPSGTPGATLGTSQLATLASSSALLFQGDESIQIYGSISLGSGGAALQSVTLDSPLVQGHADATGNAQITAGALTFENTVSGNASGSAGGPGPAGTGNLTLQVGTLGLGAGAVQLSGYGSLQGSAGVLEAQGTGSFAFGGNVSLSVGQVTATSNTDYTLYVGGAMSLVQGSVPASFSATSSLGARLSVQASSFSLDTQVLLPAGTFQAAATNGPLQVGSHAIINVSGAEVALEDQSEFAPGGLIELSATGDLAIASGASLNVSGAAGGGSAGAIELVAGSQNNASIAAGTLGGSAAAGYAGGSFSLDSGTYGASPSDLSGLYAALGAAGFSSSVSIRMRNQNLTVAAGDTIQASQVTLQADAGLVTVAGQILANGTSAQPNGGTIQIVGGQGVEVDSTAALEARAQSASAASGTVEIVANGGSPGHLFDIDIAAGAAIDVSGGAQGGGLVVLRAPRATPQSGVAIGPLVAGNFVGESEIVVQGSQTYQATAPDSSDAAASDVTQTFVTGGQYGGSSVSGVIPDASAWLSASNVSAMQQQIGLSLPNLRFAPAIVVTSATPDLAITAGTNVDLSQVANGAGTPGFLAFVAGGNIDVRGAVSDGFASSQRSAALLSGQSFSYSLQAGGDITLESGSMIRTGTGSISLQAGQDLIFKDPTAVVYTAGENAPATPGFQGTPSNAPGTYFPTGGGNIEVSVGRDIVAPLTTQTTSAWLFRYGSSNWNGASVQVTEQTSWSIDYQNFDQCLGALGGGNVSVTAGRDIIELDVAIPTTGYLTTGPLPAVASPGNLVVRGGGNLSVSAADDIEGGLFVLGQGSAQLRAGGSVLPPFSTSSYTAPTIAVRETPGSPSPATPGTIGVLFGLMDATATVTAGSGVYVEGVFDPMRQGQTRANLVNGTGSAFSGYTSDTSFSAMALGGQVRYVNDPWASADLTLGQGPSSPFYVSMSGSGPTTSNIYFSRAPPTLSLVSLQSSVSVTDRTGGESTLYLAPSPVGTLNLLAMQDVSIGVLGITMDEIAPAYLQGPLAPMLVSNGGTLGDPLHAIIPVGPGNPSTNNGEGFTPVHANDPQPVLIYAVDGSVCAESGGACTPPTKSLPLVALQFPKPISVYAGQDIVGGEYEPQNNQASSVSSFVAGEDVNEPVIYVAGPGSLVIQAGRNLELAEMQFGVTHATAQPPSSLGGEVASTGNLGVSSVGGGPGNPDPALPATAASIYMLAGTANGTDYSGFAAAYLDPTNSHGVAETYVPQLASYMSNLGYGSLSTAALLKAFDALPLLPREIFLDQVFFDELKQTDIDYNTPGSPGYQSYTRGFQAVSLLFPTNPASVSAADQGNIVLNAKPVETEESGDINILAPYGSVLVGADIVPNGVDPSQGGVVSRRGGAINIMADQDIALFTSRVFTLQGGDILMWTSDGSITAGAGAKTSVLQVPLSYNIDNEGQELLNPGGTTTGAGIGILDSLRTGAANEGTMYLIAPRGEVNAGDAGIRVVGDLFIAAQAVVGVDNIQVTGSAVGVPKVEAPNVGSLTTASQLTEAVAQEGLGPETAAARANAAADLPSIITVEVVGYETTQGGNAPEGSEKKKGKHSAGAP